MVQQLLDELQNLADAEKAVILQRFFKTGPGEYGEGDLFLGIKVPVLRQVAKKHMQLGLGDIKKLLTSKTHEERMVALLILIQQYQKCDNSKASGKLFRFYVDNMRYVNNWDLVDLSAPKIVGAYLYDKDRTILRQWAASEDMWCRRVAILSTYYFIRQGQYQDTLVLARQLLKDKEDLLHKAVGWMLREIGKRDLTAEEGFLRKYYQVMPRVALRYAIERFPEKKRLAYLKGEI